MEKDLVKVDWPKEAVMQMIQMWQDYECLYNPKDKFYHNKHARYAAFNEIAGKLKDLQFDVGANEIKNKMSYLRGQYTREVAKMKERKSGCGAEENYVPSAYWYNDLNFLADFVRIRKGGCNLNTVSSVMDDSFDSSQPLQCEESPQPSKKARREKVTQPSQEDEVLAAATNVLQKITSSKTTPGHEKDESFCKFIKNELSEIINEAIKDELKESITLAVYKAKRKQRMQNKESTSFDITSFEHQ